MWTDRQEVMAVTSNFRGHSDAIGLCHEAFKHAQAHTHRGPAVFWSQH